MAEGIPRFLIPGTLCDAGAFEAICRQWQSVSPHVPTHIAEVDTPATDLDAWCQAALSRMGNCCDVIGFSLGGVLALRLIALAPQRIRRLVLIATNPAGGTSHHQERVEHQRRLWRQGGPSAVAHEMLTLSHPQTPIRPEVAALVHAMAERTSEAGFWFQGLVNCTRPDGLLGLSQWSGPLLLLSGEADPWCGKAQQQAMLAVRPDAVWQAYPGAGHYLPLEEPSRVAQAIHDFLTTTHTHQAIPT